MRFSIFSYVHGDLLPREMSVTSFACVFVGMLVFFFLICRSSVNILDGFHLSVTEMATLFTGYGLSFPSLSVTRNSYFNIVGCTSLSLYHLPFSNLVQEILSCLQVTPLKIRRNSVQRRNNFWDIVLGEKCRVGL